MLYTLNVMQFKSPKPIFDNLDYLDNPFQQSSFFVPCYTDKSLNKDYEYTWKFIYSYNGSSATFNVYRREIERLLQWTWLVYQKSIFTLKRDDIEAYVNFCISPPNNWIGIKNVARFKNKQGDRVLNEAYLRMKSDGLAEGAEEIKTATVHWLRHTGISEDVKIRPREHVRDDAGHASMQTTDRYVESDIRERHTSGKKKRLSDL